MEELFEKAEKEGLWFWNTLHGCWISPDALKRALESGQYKTSLPQDWQVRDPKEMLDDLRADVRVVWERLQDAIKQVRTWRESKGIADLNDVREVAAQTEKENMWICLYPQGAFVLPEEFMILADTSWFKKWVKKWELRDPMEHLEDLARTVRVAEKIGVSETYLRMAKESLKNFESKVTQWRKSRGL